MHASEIGGLEHRSLKESLEIFSGLETISFDHAIMEKTKESLVMPLDIAWSDVGSWDSLYDALEKDEEENVLFGNIHVQETKNCLIYGGKRLISTIGVQDLVVVDTEDALFLARRGESQKIRGLIENLKKKGAEQVDY